MLNSPSLRTTATAIAQSSSSSRILTLPSHPKSINITELVSKVKLLYESLCSIEQDDFGEYRIELTSLIPKLVHPEYLRHGDKTVKLFIACCLANILRLFAPDAPFNPEQLKEVFALFVTQLKGLSDEKNAYSNYIFYLLESLATVKSIILLLDVDNTDGEREKLLHQMFTLAYDLVPVGHLGKAVKLYLLEILQTLIDESDVGGINGELLRIIIVKCGDSRAEVRAFATELVRLCADKLQPAFGLYFHDAIMAYGSASMHAQQEVIKKNGGKIVDLQGGGNITASIGGIQAKKLEALRTIHNQMMDVGKVAPAVLVSIVPQLEEELKTEDVDIRTLSMTSLVSIWATSINTLTSSNPSNTLLGSTIQQTHDPRVLYPNLWSTWMARMNDKSSAIRLQWCKLAISLLPYASSTAMRKELQAALTEKLQDIDVKVRERTAIFLRKLLDELPSSALGITPQVCFGEEIISELVFRCRDKSEDVRLAALDFLCSLIHYIHNSHYNNDANINNNSVKSVKNATTMVPMVVADSKSDDGWINITNDPYFITCVNGIFGLIYTSEKDMRIFYEYYIEHSLLLPQRNEHTGSIQIGNHAALHMAIFAVLSEENRKAHHKWLADKARFTRYFQAFIQLATADIRDGRLLPIAQHMSDFFRIPWEAQECLRAIPERVRHEEGQWKLLQALVSPETSLSRMYKSVEWMCKHSWTGENSDNKTDQRFKPYLMTFIARRASLLSISNDLVQEILKRAEGPMEGAAKQLVESIVSEFPSLGLKYANVLEEMITLSSSSSSIPGHNYTDTNDGSQVEHLMAYARFAAAVKDKLNPSEALKDTLEFLHRKGNRRQVKFSVRIMSILGLFFEKNNLEEMVYGLNVVQDWQRIEEVAKEKAIELSRHFEVIIAKLDKVISEEVGVATEIDLNQLPSTLSKTGKKCSANINNNQNGAHNWSTLDNFDYATQKAVLGVRCIEKILLSLRLQDKDLEISLLRIIAPQLIQWLSSSPNIRLKYALGKTILHLVPRPTALTMVNNLVSLIVFVSDDNNTPLQYRDRFSSFISREYLAGNIGLIYLILIIFSNGFNNGSSSKALHIKDFLYNIHQQDRHRVPLVLASTGGGIKTNASAVFHEMSSRNLFRYEDWCMMSLVVMACHPSLPTELSDKVTNFQLIESTLRRWTELLLEFVVSFDNVSFLFDATVQLKRHRIAPPELDSKNLYLYTLSEMMQSLIRSKAMAHKWTLQAISVCIVMADEMIAEFGNLEECSNNIKCNYLAQLQSMDKNDSMMKPAPLILKEVTEIIPTPMEKSMDFDQLPPPHSGKVSNVSNCENFVMKEPNIQNSKEEEEIPSKRPRTRSASKQTSKLKSQI